MYAKIFAQIFDSSIADNYELRHFFMDMLVLADCNGVVDMTPAAIAARTRIPLGKVKKMLVALEAPDRESRTNNHDGRRIMRFDKHRNWGWVILNYARFRAIATEKDRRESSRVRARRAADSKTQELLDLQATSEPSCATAVPSASASAFASALVGRDGGAGGSRFAKPTRQAVKLQGIKNGLPETECEKFYDYYEANGWRVGKNPMRMWTAALANWKRHWIEYGGSQASNKGRRVSDGHINSAGIDEDTGERIFMP